MKPEWILFVDDEPDMEDLIRQKFRKQIRDERFQFAFAQNGRLALETLRANEEMCMVVTDINMPEMDGLTLLNELRKLDRPLRTMVVSAYGDMKNIRTAMNRGAFDFVTKPIDFQDFETTLEKTLEDIHQLRTSVQTQKELEEERNRRMEAQQEGLKILEKSALMLSEINVTLEAQVQERTKELSEKNVLLQGEIERSEELLLNILPYHTAQELKLNGKAEARYFQEVTVMFTDFRGFTRIAEQLSPADLVAEIDICFREYDRIIGHYGIEKIKTIGDSYMAASGLPVADPNHASKMLDAALDIRAYMTKHQEERRKMGKPLFEVRIGIHTGPVVAGIVGSKKFAYDIWGDTVNLSSRMESACEVGEINISHATWNIVNQDFSCIYRGEIEVKNKGQIAMYYVQGRKNENLKPEYDLGASDLDFEAANRYIKEKLALGLAPHLTYHNLDHILDVLEQAENIARQLEIPKEDLQLLRTAVMFHDAGFLENPTNHEEISCNIARETLPKFGFSVNQILKIEQLILATRLPQTPANQLGQIICDADLDYLGRSDFWTISNRLYQELLITGAVTNPNDWNRKQVAFFESHRYFTAYACQLRNAGKEENLRQIKEKLSNS